mgnify:CR=1 FL=1|tara:strand:+ start:11380 stop:11628 length:249 start_codon:yes stop_codon:yes gene_type:complete
MTLLLDTTARRYGVLPSRLLKEGDTLDIHIVNTATAWEHYQSESASAKASGKTRPVPNIPLDKLKDIWDRTKEGNNDSKKGA